MKDAIAESGVSEPEFRDYLTQALPGDTSESIHPACARKLVEGAAAYAESLGFAPHRDFRKSRRIFAGVDAAACPRDFIYGLDGRPHYIPGPDDSEERIDRVLAMLEAKLGPDGFGFEDPAEEEADAETVRAALMDWLEDEPDTVPRFYEFSGLVAGLLHCPTAIQPLKILDVLWGPTGRTWQDREEMQDFLDLLMVYWNNINSLVLDCVNPYAPPDVQCMDVWEDDFAEDEGPNLVLALRDWCAGFVRAVELWPPADAMRLRAPGLALHWEVVRLFARYEAEGHAARLDAMTEENPPRRLGSSVTAITRALRQPLP